jgi:hypothetical protein
MRTRQLSWSSYFIVGGVGFLVLAMAGCGPSTRPITYNLSKVARVRAVAPDKVLNVRVLRDGRRQNSANSILFQGDSETEYKGERVCVNAESHYAPGAVPQQITALIAGHMRQRHAFKNVVHGQNDWADYQLVGVLSTFYARQEFDYGAAVGSSFGLIGAAAVANNTEATEVRIVFTGLAVYDRTGRLVGNLSDVVLQRNGKEPSDAYCLKAYEAVNRHLYSAISTLAGSIEALVGQTVSGWAPPAPVGNQPWGS